MLLNSLDLFGSLFSLLSTYYFIRIDIKAWPIGLMATCINSWLYWTKGIYADMWLEAFYFSSLSYGWFRWSVQRKIPRSTVKYLSTKQWIQLAFCIIGLYFIILHLLSEFSDSTVAKLDALTTAISITAQFLTCYKVITSWVLWLFADLLYLLMYHNKALPFHVVTMFIYTSFAVIGYIYWARQSVPHSPLLTQAKN